MSKDNKYLFRVYHFDENGDIVSPFVNDGTSEKGFGKKEEDYGVTDDLGNSFGNLWHKGKTYKASGRHQGFSAIGKVDPKLSIYNTDYDMHDDAEDALSDMLDEQIPEKALHTNMFKKFYKFNEKNDFEFLINSTYPVVLRLNAIATLRGEDASNLSAVTLSPKFFDFDSDDVWDDLVEDIDMYDTFDQKKLDFMPRDDSNDKVVLVTTPTSKLITIDDVINRGLTTQRDFPSELVSNEVTPLRVLSEYPKARSRYFNLRDKGASGKEAFGDSFKFDPDNDIVSDNNMKKIYKDCVKWYGDYKHHNNILSGLKDMLK